jgi:hypothetical protein
MRLSVIVAFALLTACSGSDKDTSGTGDSGDSGDTADSGGNGGNGGDDTGTAADHATLGFDLDGAYEGTTFSMTWIDPATIGVGSLSFGASAWSQPAAARMEVTPGVPAEDQLTDIGGGLRIAIYVATLHQDADGDGVPAGTEPYLGASVPWAMYIEGDPSKVLGFPKLSTGWNAVTLGADASYTPVDAAAIPLHASLIVDDHIALGGGWVGDPTANARLVVLSSVAAGGGSVSTPTLADDLAGASWSISLDARPPEDHFTYLSRAGMDGAAEAIFAYADNDTSGSWTAGDAQIYPLCKDTGSVTVVYFDAITNLQLALGLSSAGASAGWIALRNDTTGAHPIAEADLTTLAFAAQCAGGGT